MIPDAHCRKTPPDDLTVASVAIADQIGRHLVPRERLGDVTRNPLRRRMVHRAQRDQTSPLMPQDHQDKQEPKIDRRDHEEVHGAYTGRMIAPERLPRLARPGWPPCHVFANRRLSDLDPELQQFAMNARRAPQWFSTLIRRIRPRTSTETLGLPPHNRDFHRQ